MGFVNLASDSVETDTVDYRGSKKFGVTYERALSDSKINYREPSEEGSEGDKTTGKYFIMNMLNVSMFTCHF